MITEGIETGMGSEAVEIIRPAAILREAEASRVVAALESEDVSTGGVWNAAPGLWQRYDRPWDGPGGMVGSAHLVGTIGVMYGAPTRHEITIYRATVSPAGVHEGWTVERLVDDALRHAGLTLAELPRAELATPPRPDPFHKPE
jgi:hypothetical protein